MHHRIDALAYINRLRDYPPHQKLVFAFMLFSLGYIAPLHLQMVITLWLAVWIVVYAGIPWQLYAQLLTVPLFFGLTSSLALVFNMGHLPQAAATKDVLLGVGAGHFFLYVTLQGLYQALQAIVRSVTITSTMYFVLLTVPFAQLVTVMRKWGCPPLITELLFLTYRFIFILAEITTEMLTAQRARLGYINCKRGLYSLSLVVSQLLHRTIEEYKEISLGLISRGYNGKLTVWSERGYHPQKRYLFEALAGYTLLLVTTVMHYSR
ncbi:MAG: cobalt ECF transporter T component CbiQ [Geminocystis sp.]|nr:cobalt ECF transporter T component CbiQ [Geminocystis sp.]HIK36938.1 cobalt ECF transporter T component CbiQ [Geminocystis sp. M7585_C2015_104]MCS7147843.1 cobalt ECF transporter T component CbiQ [Geminocystis sp.]MCX8079546.1 cobalt ECF transporter T component CbiQ [Geminocystis sp.]MDW8116790.1 cobalt ECF transporter T component CbiQ [Geminocystis sp.]